MDGTYSTGLIILSFVIAMLGSYFAFDMAIRISATVQTRRRLQWLIAGALAMGTGIWAMHFIGMLAFRLPIPMAYDIPMTIGSQAVAVLTSSAALYLVSQPQITTGRFAGGSALMGGGIAAMHYLGMAAMQVYPGLQFDPLLVLLSLVVAVGASALAISLTFRIRAAQNARGLWLKLGSAMVMGLAIVGMHYTGMAATRFAADTICIGGPLSLDNALLPGTIASFAFLLIAVLLILSAFDASGHSSRFGVTLLVVGSIVPMLIMTALFAFYEYNRDRKNLIDNSKAQARTLSQSFSYYLASVGATLDVVSAMPSLATNDLATFRRAAASFVASNGTVDGLFLIDESGQHLTHTMRAPGVVMPQLPLSDEVRHALFVQGKTMVSDLIVSPISHRPVINVIMPIWHDGQLTYGLGAFIQPQQLNTLIDRTYLPDGWLAAVFDSTGHFIARSQDAATWLGKKGHADFLAKIAEAPEGVVEITTVTGIKVTSAFVRMPESDWVVSVAIPEEVLLTDVKRASSLLLVFTLLFLLISLYLAWVLSDRIVASIHALVRPAKALGRNQVVQIPPLYLKELEEVGQALQEASEVLRNTTHEANHDSLTGLANRSLFFHLVRQHLASCDRNKTGLAVLFIDLDGFKSVNDRYGHATGDALLQAAAARIQVSLRQTDVAARIGGDEFAAVLVDVEPNGAAIVGEKLVRALATPFPLGKVTVQISASVGIALRDREGLTAEQLIAKADEAMYEAKLAGKQRYVVGSFK